MGPRRRQFESTAGKGIAIAFCTAAIAGAVYLCVSFFKGDTPDFAQYTTYVCAETGKAFRHKNVMGETIPIHSPYSDKDTGYPGEACYWTADGQIKEEPTWVLLNEAVGKPGPTYCPDCGRLVIGHNPKPKAGSKPPPLRGGSDARSLASWTDTSGLSRSR
jgi:hypothetical protein